MDNENIFDIANRLEKSFHIFLLAMKNENLIKYIDDKKHKNCSYLKEKISRIIEKSLLKPPYDSIISDFRELEKTLDNLSLIDDDKPYSQVIKLKSSIEMITNKIEEKLQNLKNSFIQTCNSPDFYSPVHNPLLSHTSQSNFQTEYPIYQNPTNHFHGSHPQPYAFQGNPQANANPTHHHPYDPHPQSHVFQENPQANANLTHQNPINYFYAPHSQWYNFQGTPQANAHPTHQNPINYFYFYAPYSQPYTFQGNSQANTNPIYKNLQTGPNPQPYAFQGNPQANANPPTPQNLPHTLASYQAPQSSHQVSHSTNRCDFPITPTILTTELNRDTGNS